MLAGKQDRVDRAPSPTDGFLRAYCEHYHSLVHVAERLVDRRDLAEEITQETLVRLMSKQPSATKGSEFAYLRMAVLNTSRSFLRHRQVTDRWRPETVTSPESPDQVHLANYESERIRDALTALSERQREVVSLRYLVGLSESETSERLGISLGSVKAHASRGKLRLKTMLAA